MPIKRYGATAEEQEVLESAKCREIVHEILNFGVNQNQQLTLIKLLSLELECRETMLKVIEVVEGVDDNSDESLTPTIEV